MDPCDLYRQHQGDIAEIALQVSRAHGLYREEEREDFVQDCHVHFLNNDCAVLRRYRGDSNILTYIRTVVENQLVDHWNRVLGKWRSSVKARMLGEAATTLERLLVRDELPFEAACEILLETGLAKTRTEVEALAAQLPIRVRKQPTLPLDDPDCPVEPVARERPDLDLEAKERQREAKQISECLRHVSASLSPPDRLALTLRFKDGLAISQIADLQGIARAIFFRRFKRLLETVRKALVSSGVAEARVRELLRDELWTPLHDDWEQNE